MAAAGGLDAGHEASAGACHERGSAGRGKGGGDLDRATFDASGFQRRQHLQHHGLSPGSSIGHGVRYIMASTGGW
jgi:hypothetical protein